MNNNRGFTLIEALVSVIIVSIVGLMIATLLSRTFISNSKTQLLSTIKQNGQSSLNYIDTAIRAADSVVCVNTFGGPPLTAPQSASNTYTGSTIVVKSGTPISTTYTRFQIIPAPVNKSSGGSIRTDSPTVPDQSTDYTLCDANVASTGQSLINTAAGSNLAIVPVAANAPFFTLYRSSGSEDTVKIQYALTNQGTSQNPELTIAQDQIFQTTVTLR